MTTFKETYNRFDSRALKGDDLRRFYIDDFTKDSVNEIIIYLNAR